MLKKSKKVFRKFGALVMTLAMVASVMTVNAFAIERPPHLTGVEITQTIDKNVNAYTPVALYTYTVKPGAAAAATASTPAIYAGPKLGVIGTVIAFGATLDEVSHKGLLVIDTHKFENPGVYRYIVQETAGSIDGMTYSTDSKILDIYVNSDGDITSAQFDKADMTAKDNGVFTNTYATSDMTIGETVTGNQGDRHKDFTFTVTVKGGMGEMYKLVVGGKTLAMLPYLPTKITLRDGQTATIYGLSANDTYTVSQDDYADDGYTTKVDGDKTGKIAADTTVQFTNDRSVLAPTGVIMTIAPYVLMVALAGGIAFFFLRKKRAE